MKQFITFFICSVLILNLSAQEPDTTNVNVMKKNVVTVIEDDDKVHVKLGEDRGVEVITDDWGDTTHVRIGRRTFKVIEGSNGTYVKIDKDKKEKNWGGSFNPHWAGLEFGMNMMQNTDYSIYGEENYPNVFEIKPGKSMSWCFNFAEFAFKNKRKTFGVVTGMGISFNDYAFDLPVTLEKEDGYGMILPVHIEPEVGNVRKSKLHITYLNVPLILEVKTPLRMGSSKLYLAAGAIGGLRLGSHTKVRFHNRGSIKAKGNFHINQWKYDLTGRIGFGDICIFANYNVSSIFKANYGPKLHPLLIGISLVNL